MMRMAHARGGRDFHHEALGAEYGGQFGLEDLERDSAVVFQVLGEIDRRHAPAAHLPLDPVEDGQGSRQLIETQ